MTEKKYVAPIHIKVKLANGVNAAVLCKDEADAGDLYTANIEKVTCFPCLETYDTYLTLVEQELERETIEQEH